MPTVSAWVKDETYDRYKKIAEENNCSISSVIKQALDNAKIVDVKKVKSIEIEGNRELKRIRKNINVVTKYCEFCKGKPQVINRVVYEMVREIYNDCKTFQGR